MSFVPGSLFKGFLDDGDEFWRVVRGNAVERLGVELVSREGLLTQCDMMVSDVDLLIMSSFSMLWNRRQQEAVYRMLGEQGYNRYYGVRVNGIKEEVSLMKCGGGF